MRETDGKCQPKKISMCNLTTLLPTASRNEKVGAQNHTQLTGEGSRYQDESQIHTRTPMRVGNHRTAMMKVRNPNRIRQ